MNRWLQEHRDWLVDFLRIYLGGVLLYKGFEFLADTDALIRLMKMNETPMASALLAHYIVIAHICGGVLLLSGLLTRFAAMLQVPVLIGAVLFIHAKEGFMAPGSNLPYAAMILLLLFHFSLYGSGRLSADHYIETHKSV
ncbi:DoxX family protein [Leptospira gomenensis]|uniref:DoxX family protein n=1 Tax=Leptospira gomenensis TaxID=2484974 RepID=A0A5F1YBR5_9LEPT|nr:DoxX family protein [Leptospira gomenensis]TGK34705.1 DoxX family protein [Leptospira gomenensis]TGK40218.1 DoxX family protein [Leptospira gomenensis]TGK41921.1 DoxX family protein [Leptospira gomenensis]TGK55725.1 DoxX family protein [Leptospira gomenensis]